jgi:hypothetical protein
MESPPQFAQPAPAPKKSNAFLIIVLVILGLCALCCVGIGIVGYNAVKGFGKGTIGCVMHYEAARIALSEYAAANDGKLPPADSWQDAIAPYYGKSKASQQANGGGFFDIGDARKDLGCAAGNDGPATGMAFNADLAGKTVTEAKQTPSTILFFEVAETGRNIAKPYKKPEGKSPGKMFGVPRDWIYIPVTGNVSLNANDQTRSQGVNGL